MIENYKVLKWYNLSGTWLHIVHCKWISQKFGMASHGNFFSFPKNVVCSSSDQIIVFNPYLKKKNSISDQKMSALYGYVFFLYVFTLMGVIHFTSDRNCLKLWNIDRLYKY